MKVLTRKSRTAILIFLSVITLTLVAHITLTQPHVFKDANFNQYAVETTAYKQLKQAKVENRLAGGNRMATRTKQFINAQTVVAFRPWTVLASPRAPPA